MIAAARAQGLALGFSIASCFRSQAHYRRGDVRRAEADARASVEVAAEEGWGLGIPAARASSSMRCSSGATSRARAARWPRRSSARTSPTSSCSTRSSRAGAGCGSPPARSRRAWPTCSPAASDSSAGAFDPSVIPSASTAEGLHRVGEVERARELADEEVELARRTELPRALGMALRVSGLVHQDRELSEESIGALERGPSLTELAHARIDLGGTLRRTRHRAEAKEHLRLALDEADRAGAGALVAAARQELLAAGARPRRARLSGREALTASELASRSRPRRGSATARSPSRCSSPSRPWRRTWATPTASSGSPRGPTCRRRCSPARAEARPSRERTAR